MAIRGKQLAANTITADKVDTTDGAISTVNAGDAAVEGSGTGLSKRDHQHAVATGGTTAGVEVGDAAAEGASSNLAREDHVHAVTAPAAPANVTKAAAATGSSVNVARQDHKHDVDTASASTITDTTNSEGASTSLARADHGHAHGTRGGGTLHSAATTGVAGFMAATDKVKLDTLQDAAGIDAKESCRLRTTGTHGLSGLSDIDDITPLSGDRILVDQQSTGSQDGIYVADSGAWSRAADAPTGAEARGWIVHIEEGTASGDKLWQCINNEGSDVVGTHDLTFAQVGQGAPRGAGAGLVLNGNDLDVGANADGSIVVNADDVQVGILATDAQHGVRGGGTQHADATTSVDGFMSAGDKTKLDGIATAATATTPRQERVTTEDITNTDTALADTLDNTPYSNASVLLLFNGVAAIQGAGEDYTISGTTITWLASTGTAPNMKTTDDLVAYYMS